jgi:hypothetical protein
MLDELARDVFQPPPGVLSNRLLLLAAPRTQPFLRRHLVGVNLPLHLTSTDPFSRRLLASGRILPPRLFDLPFQLRVLSGLGFSVDLRLLLPALAHKLLEEKLQLVRIHPLGALADTLPSKFQHQQL